MNLRPMKTKLDFVM